MLEQTITYITVQFGVLWLNSEAVVNENASKCSGCGPPSSLVKRRLRKMKNKLRKTQHELIKLSRRLGFSEFPTQNKINV